MNNYKLMLINMSAKKFLENFYIIYLYHILLSGIISRKVAIKDLKTKAIEDLKTSDLKAFNAYSTEAPQ